MGAWTKQFGQSEHGTATDGYDAGWESLRMLPQQCLVDACPLHLLLVLFLLTMPCLGFGLNTDSVDQFTMRGWYQLLSRRHGIVIRDSWWLS